MKGILSILLTSNALMSPSGWAQVVPEHEDTFASGSPAMNIPMPMFRPAWLAGGAYDHLKRQIIPIFSDDSLILLKSIYIPAQDNVPAVQQVPVKPTFSPPQTPPKVPPGQPPRANPAPNKPPRDEKDPVLREIHPSSPVIFPKIEVAPGFWYLDYQSLAGETQLWADVQWNWETVLRSGKFKDEDHRQLSEHWEKLSEEKRTLRQLAKSLDVEWARLQIESRAKGFGNDYTTIKREVENDFLPSFQAYQSQCAGKTLPPNEYANCENWRIRLIDQKQRLRLRSDANISIWHGISSDIKEFYSGKVSSYNEKATAWHRKLMEFDEAVKTKCKVEGGNHITIHIQKRGERGSDSRIIDEPGNDVTVTMALGLAHDVFRKAQQKFNDPPTLLPAISLVESYLRRHSQPSGFSSYSDQARFTDGHDCSPDE